MTSRRDFLARSAIASTVLAAAPAAALAAPPARPGNTTAVETSVETRSKARIAVITWTYGIDDPDELFARIKATGFDYVQYCGDFRKQDAAEVARAASRHGITILSYDPPGTIRPESPADGTVEKAVEHFARTFQFARDIGAGMATLQGLSSWTVFIEDYDEAMRFIIEATRRLDAIAGRMGLVMTYEACCHYELPWVQTADELLRIHRESGAQNLQLVLDSFHMNIAEADMLEPLRKVGPLLHSYHVSDSGRGGIGTGHIDFVAQHNAMKTIGFDGFVFFELVIAECRPYKHPMNERQMAEFIRQNQYSIRMWNAITSG
nr:sugar phosphate isomerase/epimerase family protein [Stenotrophomonas sp. MMGLT7]